MTKPPKKAQHRFSAPRAGPQSARGFAWVCRAAPGKSSDLPGHRPASLAPPRWHSRRTMFAAVLKQTIIERVLFCFTDPQPPSRPAGSQDRSRKQVLEPPPSTREHGSSAPRVVAEGLDERYAAADVWRHHPGRVRSGGVSTLHNHRGPEFPIFKLNYGGLI